MSSAKHVRATPERQLYSDPAAARVDAIDKIAAARVWLLKEKPFFGVLARALVVEASLATAAFRLAPDDRLLVNPLSVLELRFPSLCARLAHLSLHAALGAFARRGPREALRWNLAHDLAIEPLLRAAQLGVGEGAALELPAAGASAEEIYAALDEGARPDDPWCDLADPPPKVDAPPAGTFTRQDDGEGDDPGEGKGGEGEGDDDGDGTDTSEGAPDDAGDVDEPSPMEARGRELQWKMRLGAALEEEIASGGKTFGERPAWIDELVRATIEPPPDFSAVLQRSIATLTRTDRSFLRPSRRLAALAGDDPSAYPDVVAMPGRRVVLAGRLAAVVDTSASIEEATLARFLGALAAVATAEGFDEVRLVQADAAVTRDETIGAAELLFQKIPIVGRGGTDFGPALTMLAEEARRTFERFTVVYLTDLDGRFPEPADVRPLEVLWVVPQARPRPAPFGHIIEMAPRSAASW